jgi:hypothetical protein
MRRIIACLALAAMSSSIAAQAEEAAVTARPEDAANQNAIYQRPFIVGGQRAALGGYMEANLNYRGEDGVDEGPGFELRRFNLFVYSAIGAHLRFLSELEFEHGTEEIKIETALLDIEIAPELVVRAGVLLTPLGAFNQAHDGPRWDFIERPLVSTTLIPSTFSELGAGVHGTFLVGPLDLDYQLYLTQGLADGIVDNATGRTDIAAGRAASLFEEDNNGRPALTGRAALRYEDMAELGLSGWRGAYNTFEVDGARVDAPRSLTIAALDASFQHRHIALRAEAAWAWIQLPPSLRGILGDQQRGMHLDAVAPVWTGELLGFEGSSLNLGARLDLVDYHAGTLRSTGQGAGESVARVTGAVSLRPGRETVLRLNYSREWITDLVGNAPARAAALQLGLSTYF